jgi:hypothetical protein
MLTILRTLLTAFLLLALPWQGYAQASMVGCETMHRNGPATPAHGHDARADHAMMQDAQDHCAHMALATPDEGSAPAQPDDSGCGSCAPCCVGAAMATAIPIVAKSSEFFSGFVTPTPLPASAERHRLDRPPRPFPA